MSSSPSSVPRSAITPRLPGIRFVHSPGPTHVPDEVMHAMQRPMTDLADPRVAALIAAAMAGLFHYVPNTHVRWRHAWAGGVFVAAGLEVAKRLLAWYVGQVPTKYYLDMRLRRARELLLQTAMSIMEIAVACGFQSPPHFSKCYRGHFGRPPTAERQPRRGAGPPGPRGRNSAGRYSGRAE